jgi:hypothetical protein
VDKDYFIKPQADALICDKCGKPWRQLKGRQKLCEPIPGDPCINCNFGKYRPEARLKPL